MNIDVAINFRKWNTLLKGNGFNVDMILEHLLIFRIDLTFFSQCNNSIQDTTDKILHKYNINTVCIIKQIIILIAVFLIGNYIHIIIII